MQNRILQVYIPANVDLMAKRGFISSNITEGSDTNVTLSYEGWIDCCVQICERDYTCTYSSQNKTILPVKYTCHYGHNWASAFRCVVWPGNIEVVISRDETACCVVMRCLVHECYTLYICMRVHAELQILWTAVAGPVVEAWVLTTREQHDCFVSWDCKIVYFKFTFQPM